MAPRYTVATSVAAYPAKIIQPSRSIMLAATSGAGKRDMLRHVLSGRGTVPAARLRPAGDLAFIADRAAAGE